MSNLKERAVARINNVLKEKEEAANKKNESRQNCINRATHCDGCFVIESELISETIDFLENYNDKYFANFESTKSVKSFESCFPEDFDSGDLNDIYNAIHATITENVIKYFKDQDIIVANDVPKFDMKKMCIKFTFLINLSYVKI